MKKDYKELERNYKDLRVQNAKEYNKLQELRAAQETREILTLENLKLEQRLNNLIMEVIEKKEKQENIVQDLLKDHKEAKNEYNKYKEIISTLKEKISAKENKFKENINKLTKIIQELKDKVNLLILEEKFKSKKLQLQKLKEQKVTKETDKSNLLKRTIKILK